MDFGVAILYIFFLILISTVDGGAKNCAKEVKCAVGRARGLKSVDCYNRDVSDVPKCMPYDAEVIELSHNRIRKVGKTDLTNYQYVRYLYLAENRIHSIDTNAFTDLKSLETLDLTDNTIQDLPPVIFHLPSLKVLYLRQNWNINIVDSVENAKPISSPLTKLDISVIIEEGRPPSQFPDFGELPLLVFLNISFNQFTTLTPKLFAGLCNLQFLVNENVTVEDYEDPCDCWKINDWLNERKVNFNSTFPCEIAKKACKNSTVSDEDIAIYDECRGQLSHIETTRLWVKIGIWTGIIIGIIVIMIIIAVIYRMCNKGSYTKAKSSEKSPMDDYTLRPIRMSEPEFNLLGIRRHSKL